MENSWNTVGNSEGTEKKEVNYIKFPEGATIIRLLDKAPVTQWTHWLKAPANGGKGVGVVCIGKSCPVCALMAKEKAQNVAKENRAYTSKKTHMINILIKKSDGTKEVALLEQGNGLFGQLKDAMVMMASAGLEPDLTSVDIMVNRTGTGFSNTKYSVMPLMNKLSPLTAEELAMEKYDLATVKPILTAEQIIAVSNGAKLEDIAKENDSSNDVNVVEQNNTPITAYQSGIGAMIDVDFTQPLSF